MFSSCDPPGGAGSSGNAVNPTTPTTTGSGKIATTVSGRITTPAGNPVTTAQVWASTDPANKVKVDTTDGSWSLPVSHSGSFTITAEDTDDNYQTSDPKPFNDIKAENIDGQDIGLKYGRTTTVSGKTRLYGGTPLAGGERSGITVTIEVEGVEVGRTTSMAGTGSTLGSYNLNDVAHNGRLTIKANFRSYTYSYTLTSTARAVSHIINMYP